MDSDNMDNDCPSEYSFSLFGVSGCIRKAEKIVGGSLFAFSAFAS